MIQVQNIVNSMARQQQSRRDFEQIVEERGFTALGPYIKNKEDVIMRCPTGHEFNVSPAHFKKGGGCIRCFRASENQVTYHKFVAYITSLGGTVQGVYVNSITPIECTCLAGHPCLVRAFNVLSGQGICKICARQDSTTAKAEFLEKAAKASVTIVGEYVNNGTPILAICPQGHECRPSPNHIQGGRGFCAVCSHRDPVVAGQVFMAWMNDHGFQVLGEYRGSNTPVKAICPKGHPCQPYPSYISMQCGMWSVQAGVKRGTTNS